jgi:N6-adenosine-specific RNA methylase IME4
MKGARYGAIYADPPWSWKARSAKGNGRSASAHYAVMDLGEIKALPIHKLAGPDCALFIWAIDSMLPEALETIEAWGFKFKTVGFYWAKTNKSSDTLFTGMGFWTRANPEQCLLATRGHPKRLAADVQKLVVERRREHSQKPDEVRARIERLVAGPYLEIFARDVRKGWHGIGDELESGFVAND